MLGKQAPEPLGTRIRLTPFAVITAGSVSGVLGALAAGDEMLRPLAHLLGPWVLLTVVVSARQHWRRAALQSALVLSAAVVAFYLTLAGMHASTLRTGQLMLWWVLALLGGTVLGPLFHRVGRGGAAATAGAACALGLVIGDLLTAIEQFGPAPVLLGFAVVAFGAVLALARPNWFEGLCTVALAVPASVIALVVVAAPDELEHLLIFG
jgi:hypothetical protein